jgi:plastocyanin
MRRYDFLVRILTPSVAGCFLLLCRPALATTTHFVSIKDSTFVPDRLAIYPGDTVTWKQEDSVEHTVTSSERAFNSNNMAPGDVFSFTFESKGEFSYYCVFHGAGAMSGVISVVEPT